MGQVATRADAYRLLHEGALAMAQVEANGMAIDLAYLDQAITSVKSKIATLEKELMADEVYTVWKKRFGDKTKLGSRSQLADVFFKELGFAPQGMTATGRFAAGKSAMEKVDHPFARQYLRYEQWKKVLSTNLEGIRREQVGGYLHPFFNLHTVRTYRSCVSKGTMIEVVRDVSKYPEGIPIENVRVGDFVYCYDKERNLVLRKVLWAGKTGHRKVLRLHWKAWGRKGYLDVTPEHLVRIWNGEYVQARRLEGADFRSLGHSKHSPKVSVLSLGRDKDCIVSTGSISEYDHRFVYRQLVGPLSKKEMVHHKDGNHQNNNPSNLEKMTASAHARLHAPTSLTDKGRRKGVKNRVRNHQLYGDRWPSGPKATNWIGMTKIQLLRMLASHGGMIKHLAYNFGVIKNKARVLGVDLKVVKDRYDRGGHYISLGRIKRSFCNGRTEMKNEFGVNFYKLKRMLEQRGFSTKRRWANQFGTFIPNNHSIVSVEWIDKIVDVYDLEIEECHNFIANEICVHNSSDTPNFQNFPTRDAELGEIVRRCFVPRKGHVLLEIDFKGIEVGISCAYHKDPTLISYVKDPTKDMHRDTAMELFSLTKEQVDKKTTRDWSKNRFVFPQFYGSVWFQCAPHLWEAVEASKATIDGVSLKKHLKKHGVSGLGRCEPKLAPLPGTFGHRVAQIEKSFWRKRFPVYKQWRYDCYDAYKERGYFDLLTGFREEGVFSRNDVANHPVQGAAFHCNLWVLIRMIKWLRKHKMKTLLIGQVHDSENYDAHKDEWQEVAGKVRELVQVDLPKHWPWINVPLDVEVEMSETDWFSKKAVEL